ncbi:MAG: hypothetical protein ACK4NV_10985 [Pannonibacter sp.]
MLKSMLMAQTRQFGRRYAYDTTFLEDLVAQDLTGGLKLGLAMPFLDHRFGLPAAAYFAARFVTADAGGCGDCAELVLKLAEEAGVARHRLLPLLGAEVGDVVEPDLWLAAAFARAVLQDSPDQLDLGERVLDRFGRRGRIGIAAAIASEQVYTVIKRGTGHALQCGAGPLAHKRKAGA